MAVWNEADWRQVGNYTLGAMHRPMMGLVLHHTVGPLDAAEARFNHRPSSASAHFGNPLDARPRMRQWVDTDDVAWAQVEGNWTGWVSLENESLAYDDPATPYDDVWAPLNEPQLERAARLFRWLHDTEGVPLQVSDDPNVPGLAYHSMNPPAWGRTGCPGQPIVDQRPEIVARAINSYPIKWVLPDPVEEEMPVRYKVFSVRDGGLSVNPELAVVSCVDGVWRHGTPAVVDKDGKPIAWDIYAVISPADMALNWPAFTAA